LELGGKSPVYLDNTVDFPKAVRRILWGKFVNAGQTCIAPDYLLCSKEVEKKFLDEAKIVFQEWYGDNVQASPDFSRICTEASFQRIINYLRNGTVALGGKTDISANISSQRF